MKADRPAVSRRTIIAALPAIAATRAARAEAGPLRVVAPWEYTSDEPSDIGYILTRMAIAETLVGVRPDGTLEGLVAERWAVDPDQLTWRFHLRPGLAFHDGSPVTPAAVLASLHSAFRGESLSNVPLAALGTADGAVLIRTTTPFAPLPAFLVDYASVILAPTAPNTPRRILGTGPYRITQANGSRGFEAERFDLYWGPKPPIRRTRYIAVPNGDTRANIAVAGDADLVFTLAPQALPRVAAASGMRVESATIPRLRLLTMNLGLPQFADVRVRRAISMGIDRRAIASGILRHPASAATQLLPPVLADWHNPALPPLRTDPAAARLLLDQAGWQMGADGVRAKDGTRLAATVMVPSNRPELPVIATALQAQLRAIGFDLAIDVGLSAALPEAVRSGTLQMGLIARTYVNVPDPIGTIIPDTTRERSVWGTLNWPDRARMKALTDAYVTTFDTAAQASIRAKITTLLHEELPIIPISCYENAVAVSTRLRGLVLDPFETRYYVDRVDLV